MTTETKTDTDILSDEQIHREVLDELRWDARVMPNEIGVSVKDGVVSLTGWVDSYSKKWAAEEAAHRIRGVKAVVNDIEVHLPVSPAYSDPEIAEAAIRALKWDALLPAEKIQVTVSKGIVTLKGQVEWQFQKEDAEDVVRRLVGVRGVLNLIAVKPRVEPKDLKKNIEQALVRSAKTDAQQITVEVKGSQVILRGTVRSWAEKQEAERAAWQAAGVTEVDNRIKVSWKEMLRRAMSSIAL
ncbi:MAG TPA: BON domain-containing protein [Nitrospira sp.]|nr:BON domain-containing protein [Nitrospira sp.]